MAFLSRGGSGSCRPSLVDLILSGVPCRPAAFRNEELGRAGAAARRGAERRTAEAFHRPDPCTVPPPSRPREQVCLVKRVHSLRFQPYDYGLTHL